MKRLILILFITSVFVSIYGQSEEISVKLDNVPFNTFIDELESLTPVTFYYPQEWVDSIYISINAEKTPLEVILRDALKEENLNFYITKDKRVIFTRQYTLKTNYKEEYTNYLISKRLDTNKNTVKQDTVNYVRPKFETTTDAINDEFKIFRIGKASSRSDKESTLTGRITNISDGSSVPGVIVYVSRLDKGVTSNDKGQYSISLPTGQYQIEFRMIGMKTTTRTIDIYSDGALDVKMAEESNILNEVIIAANRENAVREIKAGIMKIDVKKIRQIPMALGEADVIKSSLLLPGVQTVSEASSGFNVRGGSSDQNLILLDYAPIINSSHFFGFFSAFNSELIKDVALYKGSMPTKFGGRISSVMDITPLEGNKKNYRVSGGISPVTGRVIVEGPVRKEKSSFIIGARSTYSNWLLSRLKDEQLQNSSADFHDFQGMLSGEINDKNSYSISGYYSRDKFDYYQENSFNYGNMAATAKWKHTFNSQLSAQFYAIASNYDYQLVSPEILNKNLANTTSYKIDQKILRADFLFFKWDKHKTEFGLDATLYKLMPGQREPYGEKSEILPKKLEDKRALQPSFYISDEYTITPSLSVSAGLRGTFYSALGPNRVYQYSENQPVETINITDTLYFKRGNILKLYPNLDIRISSRYLITPSLSVKLGYQRVNQYIHMVSNNTSMSPTDVWTLSDNFIKPQRSDQVSAGLFYAPKSFNISLESYYKKLDNLLDYKSGAVLLMNSHLETDIIQGEGKAYGLEFLIERQQGSFTGWISYTYSRTFIKIDSKFRNETVNGGKYFPTSYDKPHDLKVVTNLKLSRRLNVTANFNYNTGRPITYPVAFYRFNNTQHIFYSDRNEFRIPDYARLDLAATFNGNLKLHKPVHSSLTISFYNALGRNNPFSIFFRNEDGRIMGYQMSIFARPIFMVTYNFKIRGNASDDY